MLGVECSSEQLAFQYVFLGIPMPYLAFGFDVVTRRAKDLKIAPLVGTTIYERNNVVEGK